jgi:hypothetical protein
MVGILCPECGLEYDNGDLDEAYCPWCDARNPEGLEALVWAELRALEDAGQLPA